MRNQRARVRPPTASEVDMARRNYQRDLSSETQLCLAWALSIKIGRTWEDWLPKWTILELFSQNLCRTQSKLSF